MVQMTSDIALSGVACTSGVTPRQLVQSSSENDTIYTWHLTSG
ncbi:MULTISPECIES: NTP-binding protein [Enterobacteriaceae]